VSTKGKRSHTTNEQNVTRFPAKRHLRVVKDELADIDQPLPGGAMALARDECPDDRPPAAPEGPGAWLRRNREAHALSLEDLERATKIRKTILIAIETSDVRHLPAPIYTRGFIKAYAREVGLEPERTADEYLAAITAQAADSLVDDAARLAPVTHAPVSAMRVPSDADTLNVDNSMGQFGWITTILAVIGLIAYLGYLGSSPGVEGPSESAAVGTDQAAGSDAAPAARGDALPDAARAVAGPFRLELSTQALCWVVVRVDGEQVLRRLLQPGERHAFEVDDEAVMRIGEPGALTISIDGRAVRPLGPAGQPIDVAIDRTNVGQYLGAQ
jgi:cytoskeleton protein RodZ